MWKITEKTKAVTGGDCAPSYLPSEASPVTETTPQSGQPRPSPVVLTRVSSFPLCRLLRCCQPENDREREELKGGCLSEHGWAAGCTFQVQSGLSAWRPSNNNPVLCVSYRDFLYNRTRNIHLTDRFRFRKQRTNRICDFHPCSIVKQDKRPLRNQCFSINHVSYVLYACVI